MKPRTASRPGTLSLGSPSASRRSFSAAKRIFTSFATAAWVLRCGAMYSARTTSARSVTSSTVKGLSTLPGLAHRSIRAAFPPLR